ncbi:MAG: hypothetical protein QNJ58_08445 [Desulfobacterales bacterium]|nr:hypothetical protein [Desulfobacterales bacterium]
MVVWIRWILFPGLVLLVGFASGALADADQADKEFERYKWFVTAYGGAHAQDDIGDVFSFQARFEDNAYIAVLALAREFWHYKNYLSFELEGQVGKHFNKDTHWEFVGVLIGRWHYFPWNKWVNTTFAVGDGISYYTDVSEVEEEDDDDAQRTLNYLLFELTLGLPEYQRWDLVFRIHHRSSVFGLVGAGGSNFVTGGFKFAF